MKLHFVGINHNDVLGRSRLIRQLADLAATYNKQPSFVAVEMGQQYFEQVRCQRPAFRELVKTMWQDRPWRVQKDSILDVLSLSLGYEADAHSEVFPDAPVLWLDDGRKDASGKLIKEFALLRLGTYTYFLNQAPTPATEETVLQTLSSEAWKRANIRLFEPYRDLGWRDRVVSQLRQTQGQWALVIIGALHAKDFTDALGHRSLYTLLKAEVDCTVHVLRH